MRRLLIPLAVLAFFGAVQAQQWVGVRTGYPLGVTLHYGTALPSFDLRVSGRVVARGESVRFGVALDALTTVAQEGSLRGYVGAGPALEIGPDDLVLDVHALAGGELRFVELSLPELGVFAEASVGGQLDLSDGTAHVPSIGAALGVNWHF